MTSRYDLVGKRFGKLTVITRVGSTGHQKALWLCQCDCGGKSKTTTGALNSGTTKSCGCRRKDVQSELGKERRVIDYSSLQCHVCGRSVASRFLSSDGSLKKGLCLNSIPGLTCERCQGDIARYNGRIPSERNSLLPISDDQMDAIVGSILGDGSLEKTPVGQNPNWGLAIKHSLKQEAYCLWKARILGDLVSKVDYPEGRVRVRTKKHRFISNVAAQMHRDGRKAVDRDLVNAMGPLGYAIWYLDDGSLLPNRVGKKGQIRKPSIRFSTCSFSSSEQLVLREIIDSRVGVKTTRCQWVQRRVFGKELPEPKRFFGIKLYGEHADKFLDFIRPYVDWDAANMRYKCDTTLRGPVDNKHTRRRK